ncbi:29665_t:CDS:2, partial [Gigaspora margarita]
MMMITIHLKVTKRYGAKYLFVQRIKFKSLHLEEDDDSNDSYKEILIECNNEESLEYSNNEKTGSETDDEEIE